MSCLMYRAPYKKANALKKANARSRGDWKRLLSQSQPAESDQKNLHEPAGNQQSWWYKIYIRIKTRLKVILKVGTHVSLSAAAGGC